MSKIEINSTSKSEETNVEVSLNNLLEKVYLFKKIFIFIRYLAIQTNLYNQKKM